MSIVWPAVKGFQDGDSLTAATLNTPIFNLAHRTETLKRMLLAYLQESNGNTVLKDVPLAPTNTPQLYDAVTLTDGGAAIKALQPLELDEHPAVGLVISITGATCTILINGTLDVTADALDGMLDHAPGTPTTTGYLSRTAAGKLTTVATGTGFIICDILSRGAGYTLAVAPRPATYKGHVHESVALHARPVGTAFLSADDPSGEHDIHGYYPDTTDVTQLAVGAHAHYKPRLLLGGSWTKRDGATYTFWLSTQSGVDRVTSTPPATWSEAYIHWTTDNPELPGGSARLYCYGAPARIGDTGLTVALEVPVEAGYGGVPVECDHREPYQLAAGASADDRTWTLELPYAAQGWVRRRLDTVLAANEETGARIVAGGAFDANADYHPRAVTVESLYSYLVDMTDINSTWNSLTITTGDNTWRFRMDHSGSSVTAGARTAVVELDSDPEVTLRRLVDAAREILPADSGIRIIRAIGTTDFIVAGRDPTMTLTLVTNVTPTATVLDTPDGAPGELAHLVAYDNFWVSVVATAHWDATAGLQGTAMVGGGRLYYAPASAASPVAPTVNYKASAFFDSAAPYAPFIYMLGTHSAARSLYPPVPITAMRLELNGVLLDAYDGGPHDYTYVAGADALYWKQTGWGAVPWPTYWAGAEAGLDPMAVKKLRMHTSFGLLDTGIGVTSLRPAPDAPVSITRCGSDDAATTGDLEINVNLNATTVKSNEQGYHVIKRITGSRGYTGPVVERVIAGPGITVQQNYGAPVGQGVLTIGLAGNQEYTGEFDTIALENAKQTKMGMFSYIKLLGWDTGGSGNISTGLTAQFRIPHTLANKQYGVIVYATVMGTEATSSSGPATFAGLEFSYSAVHDLYTPDGTMTVTNVSLKNTPLVSQLLKTAVQFHPGYTEYDPMIIHNSPDEPAVGTSLQQVLGTIMPEDNAWTLRPGSLVALRLARGGISHLGATHEYKHPVGIVNLRWRLVTLGE